MLREVTRPSIDGEFGDFVAAPDTAPLDPASLMPSSLRVFSALCHRANCNLLQFEEERVELLVFGMTNSARSKLTAELGLGCWVGRIENAGLFGNYTLTYCRAKQKDAFGNNRVVENGNVKQAVVSF